MWWKKEPSRRTFGNREGWTQQVKSEDLFEDIPETKVEENSIEDDQQELIQRLEKFIKENQRNSECDQSRRIKKITFYPILKLRRIPWKMISKNWSKINETFINETLSVIKAEELKDHILFDTKVEENNIENDQQELIKD